MQTFNIHDAKTHLSRLVEQAANGEPFVIAKAGKPMVKVVALDVPEPGQMKRIGFLADQATVPEATLFNTLGSDEEGAQEAKRQRSEVRRPPRSLRAVCFVGICGSIAGVDKT